MSRPLPPLMFLRHGATALNLAGLRCGGDIDVPMSEIGHRQAAQAAQALRQRAVLPGVIVVSGLQRARQTAEIVSRMLPRVEIVVEPGFDERRLGDWNRRSIAETQADLATGVTPPGGEASAEFAERITAAVVRTLLPLLPRQVLLVGSKGVARVLGELVGQEARPGNAELVEFDLGAFAARMARRDTECAA